MGDITKPLVGAWHDVSRPFVDTSLGRMAVNAATGGMSAPALAAYDINNGADPLEAGIRGAAGYMGGAGANDWLSGLGAPTAAGMSEQMGDWVPEGVSGMGLGGYTPLEDTVGASMDTTGLNNIGGGWLSRMGDSAMQGMGDAWSPEGIGKSLGKIGPVQALSGLSGLFSANKNSNAQQDRFNQVQNQINGMYAPGSPEYEALMQQISRTDAAAGRNSQIGPRSTDLAAKIAQIKMNGLTGSLTNQNTMFNSSLANRNSGLNGLFGLYGRANPQQ